MTFLSDSTLRLERFQRILKQLATDSARAEVFGTDLQTTSASDIAFALMCASALTSANEESAQDAILRVSQAVLRSSMSSPEQKAAAVILLERVGNTLAIRLAVERHELVPVDLHAVPIALAADTLSRREELTVVSQDGEPVQVNPFQREFWELVHTNDWVSVSAPTSAGKSHIVREWMLTELNAGLNRKLVYIAPTRALVEEVGAHFRSVLTDNVGVHTLPWDPDIAEFESQIFVLTQERMHLLQERAPHFSPDIIFVDEAQKIAEGTRGILLTQVLDEAVQRNAEIRLVFASPLSRNPGVLLTNQRPSRRVAALVGETVTVNQNLIYVGQKRRFPSVFEFALHYQGTDIPLGELELQYRPERDGERVPYIAAAVAGLSTGNLVYANGPAEAEKYARLIFQALGPEADRDDPDTMELIDFAKGVVHDKFVLAECARRGVAFHYGDMPLVLKAKVEELFKKGAIRYLVCTSTLLEGVNLPCRNIFMRGPRKGPKHMSMADFWNLAGRAGRWGKEFQGNIFCVDAAKEAVWPEKPGSRQRSEITPAAANTLRGVPAMLEYIAEGGQMAGRESGAELESTFSWLSGRFLGHGALNDLVGVPLEGSSLNHLESAISSAVAELTLPPEVIKRHAGVSPLSMQRLFDSLIEHGHPESLTLVPPASDDAFTEYAEALRYVAEYLGGSFTPEARRLSLARLIVHWMRGVPLRTIIDNRVAWRRQQNQEVVLPVIIRKTMEDIEDIARFEAPRFLSCFADVVSQAAGALGRDVQNQVVDIEMMLELGVPRQTDMSFIAAGLSRATCREIVSYVPQSDMSPADCAEWVRAVDLDSLDVPAFAIREIRQLRSVLEARSWAS